MKDIFISYSHEDRDYAHKLIEILKEKGVSVWIDDRIDYGKPFPQEIEMHIDSCSAFIVIMTPHSRKSTWVSNELNCAIDNDKPIFPLLLKGTRWFEVATIQYVDVRDGQLPPDEFYELLKRVVQPDHKHRRIDAAVPSSTEVGNEIDLLVQVRFPDSPLLGEDWPTGKKPPSIEQTSNSVVLNFPIDPQTGQQKSTYLEIQVIAPDFIIHSEERQSIEVPPDEESKIVSFLLTARKSGQCRINVVLYSADRVYLDTIRLETAVGKTVAPPTMQVATLILIVAVAEQGYGTKNLFQVSQPKPVEPGSKITKKEEEVPLNNALDVLKAVLPRPTPQTPWQKYKDEQAKARPATLADLKSARERTAPAVVPHVPHQPEPKPSTLKLSQILIPHHPFEPELILIPAGEFLMGTDPKKDKIFIEAKKIYKDNKLVTTALNSEQPQHRLYLPDYYMAKTPVTNAQYAAFVQATGYQTQAEKAGSGWVWKDSKWQEVKRANWQHPTGPDSDISQKSDHPVVQVNLDDAVAYCRWLTEVTGKACRLPTEAEWEKAARGTGGWIYTWGNEWDAKRCNTEDGGPDDTTSVGAYPEGASPYGVLDMAGNVWEWTVSLWGAELEKPDFKYPYDANDGREALEAGDEIRRVLRGGSFCNFRYGARCACRGWYGPYFRDSNSGFRVAVSPVL